MIPKSQNNTEYSKDGTIFVLSCIKRNAEGSEDDVLWSLYNTRSLEFEYKDLEAFDMQQILEKFEI